jgi:hypothetical protein
MTTFTKNSPKVGDGGEVLLQKAAVSPRANVALSAWYSWICILKVVKRPYQLYVTHRPPRRRLI